MIVIESGAFCQDCGHFYPAILTPDKMGLLWSIKTWIKRHIFRLYIPNPMHLEHSEVIQWAIDHCCGDSDDPSKVIKFGPGLFVCGSTIDIG